MPVALKRDATVSFKLDNLTAGSRASFEHVAQAVNEAFGQAEITCLQPKGNNSFYLTFKKASLSARAQEQGLLFDNSRIPIVPVETGYTTVWIMDAPYELPHATITSCLASYGVVKQLDYVYIKKELGGYTNGDRKALIEMTKPVPNFLRIGGFLLRLKYAGLVQTCRKCGGEGHFASACIVGKKCAKCGNAWHTTENCDKCSICKAIGHVDDECPLNNRDEETHPKVLSDSDEEKLVIDQQKTEPVVFQTSNKTARTPENSLPDNSSQKVERDIFFTPTRETMCKTLDNNHEIPEGQTMNKRKGSDIFPAIQCGTSVSSGESEKGNSPDLKQQTKSKRTKKMTKK